MITANVRGRLSRFCRVRSFHKPTPLQKWFEDRGDHTLRLEYPLSKDSVVLDVGGYQGDWTAKIVARYGCRSYVFEPSPRFCHIIRQRFSGNDRVSVLEYALGADNQTARLALLDDGSSLYRNAESYEDVLLRDITEVLGELQISSIDLVKINIEGGEYALLPRMLSTGIVNRCADIQIQFHQTCPEAAVLRSEIRAGLSKTHFLTYDYPFVWENWRSRLSSIENLRNRG